VPSSLGGVGRGCCGGLLVAWSTGGGEVGKNLRGGSFLFGSFCLDVLLTKKGRSRGCWMVPGGEGCRRPWRPSWLAVLDRKVCTDQLKLVCPPFTEVPRGYTTTVGTMVFLRGKL